MACARYKYTRAVNDEPYHDKDSFNLARCVADYLRFFFNANAELLTIKNESTVFVCGKYKNWFLAVSCNAISIPAELPAADKKANTLYFTCINMNQFISEWTEYFGPSW
jgi:hypothetical protein